MNNNEYQSYTGSIRQLISFNKHFGFDVEDVEAIQSYCKCCLESGFEVDSEIADLANFNHGVKLVKDTVPCDVFALIDANKLLSISMVNLIDSILSSHIEDVFEFSGASSLNTVKVLSLSNCILKSQSIPFTNKILLKICGQIDVSFGFVVANRKERLSVKDEDLGYIMKDEGLVIKGRFGTPLKI